MKNENHPCYSILNENAIKSHDTHNLYYNSLQSYPEIIYKDVATFCEFSNINYFNLQSNLHSLLS